MKRKIVANGKFTLSIEEVNSILENYIYPNYPEFEFNVRKSDKSNSVYIKIRNENKLRVLRISDHRLEADLSCCLVGPKTKKIFVIRYIINSLEQLRTNRFKEILDNL